MMLAACTLGVLLSSQGVGQALQQTLVATDARILLGQPTKVTVTWLTRRPVEVMPVSLAILVDDGEGFREHRETRFSAASTLYLPMTLEPDTPLQTAHVIGVTGGRFSTSDGLLREARLVFGRPGRYRIKARYESVESNTATVNVAKPFGKDAELFEKHIRLHPGLLTEWSVLDDPENLKRLFQEYRGSPYLDRARLLSLTREIETPSLAEELARPSGRPWMPLGLDDAIATEPMKSAFEEDRLLLLAEAHRRLGHGEVAARLYGEITVKYPDGQAAPRAREALRVLSQPDDSRR
jgi:hypothetical protein